MKKIRIPVGPSRDNATYFYTGRFDEECAEEEARHSVEEAEAIIEEARTVAMNEELMRELRAQK